MTNNFVPDFNNRLSQSFFLQDPEKVAKELIGTVLCKKNNGSYLAGKIVETEAYLSRNDMSSHSYPGVTNRNKPMFAEGGILYVYKSYGIHHCINIVTEKEGIGSAVLIRALEPISGINVMISNRGVEEINRLCKGPGNTAKAYDFDLSDNYSSLTTEDLFIQNFSDNNKTEIINTTRIGISKSVDLMLRFYLKNSHFVSRK